MSIYDNIKTAKDLILEVTAHGLSTKTEDICRAQDIFGNSTVEELEALATDNGRRDNEGNPDQFGNWSSGSDGTQKIFYQIIFQIWSWEEATRYYNQHSNKIYIDATKAERENERLKAALDKAAQAETKMQEAITEYRVAIRQLEDEKVDYAKELEEKDAEIIKLKAKLYDLMASAK